MSRRQRSVAGGRWPVVYDYRLLLGLALRGTATCLFLLIPGIASAQSGVTAVLIPALASKAQVAQRAEPHFPDTVDFALDTGGLEVERATLKYRLAGQAVTNEVEADLEAASGEVTLTLELATHYIPPGSEVLYYWTLIDALGEATDTPVQSFTMLDERYRWQSLADEHAGVAVHWYKGSADFGRRLLESARSALRRIEASTRAGLQQPANKPANIWVYAGQDELLGALPQQMPEWVGGKSFPELSLVLAAIADDEAAEMEIGRVLSHELSHLALYRQTRNPYNEPPAWLDEGLATYHEEQQDGGWEEALRQAAQENGLPPLRTLSGSFGSSEDGALLAYAQSHSVVSFILNDRRYGPEKLARTLAAFGEGVTYDEALQAGLGVTTDELDSQWRASLPYEVASTAPRPDRPADPLASGFSLRNPLVLVPVAIFTTLSLAAALLAAIALLRRQAAKHS